MNINDIAFVTEAGFDKSEKFATTYSGNTIQEWNIAIQNSTEFEASLDEESLGMTKAGGRLSISINKLPKEEKDKVIDELIDNLYNYNPEFVNMNLLLSMLLKIQNGQTDNVEEQDKIIDNEPYTKI